MIKLECCHADTCLPDYWGGHHLAHLQIPVYTGMSLMAIKDALHAELSHGAVMGNEPLSREDSGKAGDQWYKAAHAAVNRMRPAKKHQRRFFTDIESSENEDDCGGSVYAFFVFVDF